ncbi:HET-domain-containing protein [Curvularia clavata]|uniref:HET-domain-containing protein n=1 Tax=Curvularia clavata TaxID=95742 RepID=A0A9Q8Z5P1_CURCL|nr:HET-domain-containing protein [Curvularia clavata]
MESVAVEEYIYRPLNSGDQEIRLITIKAGRGPDPVECSLDHVSLGDKPQYEALSYVWGNPNDRSQIILEGCNFSVTSNLGTALSYLRLPEANRSMWIDAICINQSNLAERESQIQLIRSIYQEAMQVVSWISPLETKDVIMNTAYLLLLEGREKNFSTAWLQAMLRGDVLSGDFRYLGEIVTIAKFFAQDEYWERIWITQEVALARKGLVKYKEMEIPHDYFVEFTKMFSELNDDLEWMNRDFGLKHSYILGQILEIFRGNYIVRRIAPSAPLLDLLYQNMYKKATDPRDKVYALLGLSDMAPNSHEGLTVNYGENWSKRDVYTGVVRAVVHKTSRLDIIGEARPYAKVLDSNRSPDNQEMDVPSWAPDWTAIFLRPLSNRRDSRIGAAGLIPANVEFYDDKNVMKAQGICVGTVGACGRCLPEISLGQGPNEIILCGEILHEWLQLCRSSAGDSTGTLETFSRTISIGSPASSDLQELMAGTDQRFDPSHPLFPIAEMAFPFLQRFTIECRIFIFDSIIDRSCPNLLCGIGPEELQEKDKICVLAGCKYPVALRPDGNRYRFVSRVYVDDLCDGQAIKGVEMGRYSWDWFEIH